MWEYEDVLVTTAAMQLVRDPAQFDVVVTENMFGDILSDEPARSPAPSVCCHPHPSVTQPPGLYEPSTLRP